MTGMAEYIERDIAAAFAYNCGAVYVSNRLSDKNAFPAADVAPVRRGRFVKRGCKWQCTNCKVLMSIDGTPKENLLNYCPNCGCLMDGGDDE